MLSKPIKSKRDYDEQVIRSMYQTYWFFPDEPDCSPVTANIIKALDFSNFDCSNIFDLHTSIYNTLLNYQAWFLTQAATLRILRWLGIPRKENVYLTCSPIKYYPPKYKANGYVLERYNNYVIQYDKEDVWYALTHNEYAKNIIDKRRIYNIDSLLFESGEY